MRKKGFTLLEVVLAVTLFGLMIGVILQAYTSIQLGNVKVLDTQKTIEVSENLFERLNDMSMDYVIDTGKYSESDYISTGNTKIISTGVLWLKRAGYTGTDTDTCYKLSGNNLYMEGNYTWNKNAAFRYTDNTSPTGPVNLGKYDEVNVDYLNFEIYPDQQYVNINIKTSIPGGETLQSGDGIRLTTTVGFKTYDKYEGELTAETLCEDVCSISQISNTGIKQSSISLTSMGNNQTYNACTIGQYKLKDNTNWTNIFSIFFNLIDYRNNEKYDSKTIYDIAANCKNNESTCNKNCNDNNPGTNPYNCGYIRKTIQTKDYKKFASGNSLTGCELYNSYVMSNTCEDMCKASIFSCLDTENDPLQKRTGIKVTTGKYAGLYLQNPKEYSVADDGAYSDGIWTGFNGRNCSTGTITKDTCNGGFHVFIFCINGDTIYKCNNNGVFYCSGTYYGNGYRQGATELTKTEYEKDCVAWAWTGITNSGSVKNSGTRYVYSDVLSHTGFDPCICKVDYQYSYDAGGIIEGGNCGGLNSDYTAKDENLIYGQGTGFDGQKRSNISGLSGRVGVAPILNWNNCDQNVNGVCQRGVTYNNKTYDVVGGSGMYQNNVEKFNRKNCSCTNNTGEDNFYACVDRVHPCERPAQLMTLHLNGAIQNSNESKKRYCENKVNSGVWDRNSGCLIPNGTGCIGEEVTGGYTQIDFSGLNDEQLRTNYCKSLGDEREVVGTNDYNIDTPRYNGIYHKYCRRKTNECKTYSENIITPRWYCENILALGTIINADFTAHPTKLKSYTHNLQACNYCNLTGTKVGINQRDADTYYCTSNGYDLGFDGSKCKKCDLRGTKVEINQITANDWYCKNKKGYEFGWNSNQNSCEKCGLRGTIQIIDTNAAKQRYCENKVSEGLWNGTNCLTTKSIAENTAKKTYCEDFKNYYWDNNKCYQNRNCIFVLCSYSNEYIIEDINLANEYYCNDKLTNTTWYNNTCYENFNFSNIKNLSGQYCTGGISKNRDSTFSICYENGTDCLGTSTGSINNSIAKQEYCISQISGGHWNNNYCYIESTDCIETSSSENLSTNNYDKKERKQDYCQNNLGLHRHDNYECRKNDKNNCIASSEWNNIPLTYFESESWFDIPYHFDGISNIYLTEGFKSNMCTIRSQPWINNSCSAFNCRRNRDIANINNYNDRYNTRLNRNFGDELEFSWSSENNNCKYCNNYRYEYTGIVGCEGNENCSLTGLMKWRCEHQETVLDYQWVGDSSSGFCAKYTPYKSKICSGTITPLMTGKELTGSDEYYDEIYCKEGTISGHSIRLSLTGKDDTRDEWTGNFCLDKNKHTDLCVYASSIESNWTGISSSGGSSIYYTGYDTGIYIPDDTNFFQKNRVLDSEYELILTRKIYKINYKNSQTPFQFQLGIDNDWLEGGQEKDVLKDYTYTCDLSIAQQSNNILNIIEGISKSRQIENFENNLDSVPRYLRWLF